MRRDFSSREDLIGYLKDQFIEKAVVWIHGDCLRPTNPALLACPGAPAILCWDDDLLRQWRISLKRLTFIYECLLELPVIIRRRDVATQVLAFADDHGASRVVTSPSPSSRFSRIKKAIERRIPVEVLEEEPFLDTSAEFDLRRFYRFWRRAEAFAYGAKAVGTHGVNTKGTSRNERKN
jgi:hypothetical protein